MTCECRTPAPPPPPAPRATLGAYSDGCRAVRLYPATVWLVRGCHEERPLASLRRDAGAALEGKFLGRPVAIGFGLRPGTAYSLELQTNFATAVPISSGLSSWTKCIPLMVVSVRLGQVRMRPRIRPFTTAPGWALMNSLGTSLAANHLL